MPKMLVIAIVLTIGLAIGYGLGAQSQKQPVPRQILAGKTVGARCSSRDGAAVVEEAISLGAAITDFETADIKVMSHDDVVRGYRLSVTYKGVIYDRPKPFPFNTKGKLAQFVEGMARQIRQSDINSTL
ncbi:MAG: hypothetical protein WC107_01130 [Patescibacteria group bacterium]